MHIFKIYALNSWCISYSTACVEACNLACVVLEYSNKTRESSSSTQAFLIHCSAAVPYSKHCMLLSEADPLKKVLNAHK